MHVDEKNLCVLFPAARKGLNPSEITVAEVLKEQGYATMCIGKWHMGDHPDFMPTNQGFDHYFGIPYSNDMNRKQVPLPLVRDLEVIEDSVQRDTTITTQYTEEAVKFIKANSKKPFFLYLPHTAVHLPLVPGVDDRLLLGHALFHLLQREVDDENRVFGHDPQQHQQACNEDKRKSGTCSVESECQSPPGTALR